ncbi:Nucleoporin gle1 [Trametes pubescens]|uniref:mRNA export factor GLE1 n=1 Tax=Trametes pubescens TaxID=154538 RepID=A0A1M2VHT9_TRAPU|nr:Nucleoporin gle1 [Trametes pubescens]
MLEDAVASIRLHVNHHDPYEEWEKDTRQEAFRVARQHQAQDRVQHRKERKEARARAQQELAAIHEQQLREVQVQLSALNVKKQQEEEVLRTQWKERDRKLWERIDAVIKMEEEKLRVKLEVERKKREEEERVRKEAEEKKRQEEERRCKEEAEKRKQKEKEEEEERQQAEAERLRNERDRAEEQERKALGFTTAFEDWKRARDTLKARPMRAVKADKALKAIWSAGRRAITPKIGQLTNDAEAINKISQQIVEIIRPLQPHPPPVYVALLSSLAKAILLQAETEVTAEKRSAIPLAQVTTNLLCVLDNFADVFWAKLCQRTGGWPVPLVVPSNDSDGTAFNEDGRRKALGYRGEDESLAEYSSRVTGMMRVYFHILVARVNQPLDPVVRLPRYWTFVSRMLKDPQLLDSSVAPQVLHAALDVGGLLAREVWGQQWVRLLSLLYDGVTVGYHGLQGRLIGGPSPEGVAARMRVQLEIERIMSAL